MIKKWLHIDEMSGDLWILPIWNTINKLIKEGMIDPVPKDCRDLGLHISARLNMLPVILFRLNNEASELFELAENHELEYEYTSHSQGKPFGMPDDWKTNILIDIDSLLFELNSVCELMETFLEKMSHHAGKPVKKEEAGLEIRKIIEKAKQDSDWLEVLEAHRNFFAHPAAPYIAVDITKGPGKYDLVIMKETLKSFHDVNAFFKLSALDDIVSGFSLAMPVLQKAIIAMFPSGQ